jgi:hypothetical protein
MTLNLSEAAKFVGVSSATVSQWLAQGLLTPLDGWRGRQGDLVEVTVQNLREMQLVAALRRIMVPHGCIRDNRDLLHMISGRPFTRDLLLRVDFGREAMSVVGKGNLPHTVIGANTVVMGMPVEPDFAHLYTEGGKEARGEQGE